jgi:hypothetical protein
MLAWPLSLMPGPRSRDDLVEVRDDRHPAEFVAGPGRIRDQRRWIARSPCAAHDGDGQARDTLRGFDHLVDGCAEPVTQIVSPGRSATFRQRLERADVGSRQVGDVNVVANAGSVGRV